MVIQSVKVLSIGGGIKRIVNLLTGRDVLICGERGEWVMMANFNQEDSRAVLGTFPTVAAAVTFIRK